MFDLGAGSPAIQLDENGRPILVLSPRQQEFIDAADREQCYGGAKRGGKTVAGSVKSSLLSYYFPGNRGLMARQNWPDLRDSTLTTLKKYCGQFIKDERVGDKILIMHSVDPMYPSTILYRGLGDEQDFEKTKGIDLGWLWIDEPSEVKEKAYLMLRAQLNWILPNGIRPPYMAFLTTNPEPGWVKRRYKDDELGVIAKGMGRFIQALPRDNPFLPPGWEDELRATFDPEWVQKYLDGDWNVGEYSVFALDPKIHNLDNYVRPAEWQSFIVKLRKIGGQDHASTGITAYVMLGTDADENIYALEEYYEKDRTIDIHAGNILRLQGIYGGRPEYSLIDPSTEAKSMQGMNKVTGQYEMYSVLDEYRRHGVIAIPAMRSEIRVGIDIMKQALVASPLRRHPFTNVYGSPRFFISKSRCPNLWREMEDLRKEIRLDGSIVFAGQDHATDCVRYVFMSRPRPQLVEDNLAAKLPPQQRFVMTSHSAWGSKFDHDAMKMDGRGQIIVEAGGGSWF